MTQMESTAEKVRKAFLAGTYGTDEDVSLVHEYLAELSELVRTLGAENAGEMTIPVRTFNPSLYIGSGKAEELKAAVAECGADVIIFDTPLGPSQQRNLERLCGIKVIDRQEVILDIFASRARTREAVLQVELARYKYFLPRLTGAWTHLSRQHGGGTLARGEGEKQIELDKRLLREKIYSLEDELKTVRRQRGVQRKSRLRSNVASAAIVGYTNAGKSTLLNALTGADVLAENKLFATLDPTTRRMILPDKTELVLTDTVGFIRKLPHALVEAFKSTLEEAVAADFIVLVLDVANPQVCSHWETVLSVLEELGAADKEMLVVFNKTDCPVEELTLVKLRASAPDAVFVSCRTGAGLDVLAERLALTASPKGRTLEVKIPPSHSELVSLLYSKCLIYNSDYEEDGSFRALARIPEAESCVFSEYTV